MKAEIRLSGTLYQVIRDDLARPHPFAAERMGFATARIGKLTDNRRVIILNEYHAVPDEHYQKDWTVGARIGVETIIWATQEAFRGRAARQGIFHLHLHEHSGPAGMSRTDKREIPRMILGFQAVAPESAHGTIIFSLDHGSGWVWLPGSDQPALADAIGIVGSPLRIFEVKKG